MTTTGTTAARSRLSSAVRWLDGYTLWAMNPTPTPTPRDERPATPRGAPQGHHEVVRGLVR